MAAIVQRYTALKTEQASAPAPGEAVVRSSLSHIQTVSLQSPTSASVSSDYVQIPPSAAANDHSSNLFMRGLSSIEAEAHSLYRGFTSIFLPENSFEATAAFIELAPADHTNPRIAANQVEERQALNAKFLQAQKRAEKAKDETEKRQASEEVEKLRRQLAQDEKEQKDAEDEESDDMDELIEELLFADAGSSKPAPDFTGGPNNASPRTRRSGAHTGSALSRLKGHAENLHESTERHTPLAGAAREEEHFAIKGAKTLGRTVKGAGGLVAATAGVELFTTVFDGYIKGRMGGILEGGQLGTEADGWASAKMAVAEQENQIFGDAVINLVPGVTAYQEFKAGNYLAATGWAALDGVGAIVSVISFGTAAAPVEGAIAVAKEARVVSRVSNAAKVAETAANVGTQVHRVYMGVQIAQGAEQLWNFLNTDEGKSALEFLKEEAFEGGATSATISKIVRQKLQAAGMPAELQDVVVAKIERQQSTPAPNTVPSMSAMVGPLPHIPQPQPGGARRPRNNLTMAYAEPVPELALR